MKLLEHVIAVGERTLAEEHPFRLASQRELAELLLQMSAKSAATKCFYRLSNSVRLLYVGALPVFLGVLVWYIFDCSRGKNID